jgi:hypothetical protein
MMIDTDSDSSKQLVYANLRRGYPEYYNPSLKKYYFCYKLVFDNFRIIQMK